MGNRKGKIIEDLMDKSILKYNPIWKNMYFFRAYPKSVSYTFQQRKFVHYIGKGNCDYYGIYHGKYITIEAKQTCNKNKFNCRNIPDHQRHILDKINSLNGISLLIFYFEAQEKKCFLVPWQKIKKLINNTDKQYLLINDIQQIGTFVKVDDNYLLIEKALDQCFESVDG